MAEVIRYINTESSGGDGTTNNTTGTNAAYASFEDWNTAEATDLVTAGNIHKVYCSGGIDGNSTSHSIQTGWTTNDTNYIILEAYPGNEAVPSGIDNNRYRFIGRLTVRQTVYFNNLQFYCMFSWAPSLAINYTNKYVHVKNCYFGRDSTALGSYIVQLSTDFTGTAVFENCILTRESSGVGLQIANSPTSAKFINTIVANCTDGVVTLSGTVTTFTNFASFNNTDDWNFAGTETIDYVADDDNDSGATNRVGPAGGDWNNEFVDPANGDFTLIPTGNLATAGIGPGINSDVPTTDMLGNTKAGDVSSIGAMDLAPAKGQWVKDLVVPKSILNGGFASDGAFHAEIESTDKPKFIESVLDENHPIAQGLVGCWLFNEGSGTDIHELVQKTIFTMGSSMGRTIDGIKGGSTYDDENNTIPLSDSYDPQTSWDGITVVTGCVTHSTQWRYPGLFSIGADWGHDGVALINNYGSSNEVWFSTDTPSVKAAAVVLANTYYNIAGTWDKTNLKIYLDGELKNTQAEDDTGWTPSNINQRNIGGMDWSAGAGVWRTMDNPMHYLFMFNRALSDSEIASLHRDPYQFVFRKKIEIVSDIYRSNMNLVFHQNENWGIKTVASSSAYDEHLIFHWDCSSLIARGISSGWTDITGTVNGSNYDFTSNGKRGKCLNLSVDDTDIYFPNTSDAICKISEGTISFDFYKSGSWSATDYFFGIGNFTPDSMGLRTAASGQIILAYEIDDTTVSTLGSTTLFSTDQWLHIQVGWKKTATDVFFILVVNGVVEGSKWAGDTWGGSDWGSSLYIGSHFSGTSNQAGMYDNLKVYDKLILPYGAYYTGIGSNQDDYTLVNVGNDHVKSDVTMFLDFEGSDATARQTCKISSLVGTINGATATSTGSMLSGSYGLDIGGTWQDWMEFTVTSSHINPKKGSISLWVNNQSITSGAIVYFGDTNNHIRLGYEGTTNLFDFDYVSQSTTVTTSCTTVMSDLNVWNHIRITWDDSDKIEIWLNGVREDSDVISNTWEGITSGSLILGSDGASLDCYIDQFYITNDSNTPQLWTVNYKPIVLPIIRTT